jgi:hypothetical protein
MILNRNLVRSSPFSPAIVHWELRVSMTEAEIEIILEGAKETLGGHRKSGHRGSPQNRPMGRGQDMRLLYRVGGVRGKKFLNCTAEPCNPRYTGFTWAEDSGNAGMRPGRRPRCRNGGAASSRPRS